MKKYLFLLLGLLIGIVLTITTSVYADAIKSDIQSLIGKTVQGSFPLTINGKHADKDVIVIDGASYFPVREAADKLNLKVSFDVDAGVSLDNTQGVTNTTITKVVDPQMIIEIKDILKADGKIDGNDENANLVIEKVGQDGVTAADKVRKYYILLQNEADRAQGIKDQENLKIEQKAEADAETARQDKIRADRDASKKAADEAAAAANNP